jgi:hypothetical protein
MAIENHTREELIDIIKNEASVAEYMVTNGLKTAEPGTENYEYFKKVKGMIELIISTNSYDILLDFLWEHHKFFEKNEIKDYDLFKSEDKKKKTIDLINETKSLDFLTDNTRELLSEVEAIENGLNDIITNLSKSTIPVTFAGHKEKMDTLFLSYLEAANKWAISDKEKEVLDDELRKTIISYLKSLN